MNIKDEIWARAQASSELMGIALKANLEKMQQASQKIADTIKAGNKALFFGNGGSAAEAQHFAAEFVNRMVMERRPLGAIALGTDSSVTTSIGNDRGFDQLFSMQVRALGKKGDIAFGISTSGASANVLKGLEAAKELGLYRMGLAGVPGTKIGGLTDLCFFIDSPSTARIQEVHLAIGHILCEMTDLILFGDAK